MLLIISKFSSFTDLESQIEKGVLPPVHRIPTRDQVNGVRMRARVKQEPVHPED